MEEGGIPSLVALLHLEVRGPLVLAALLLPKGQLFLRVSELSSVHAAAL